MSVTVPSATKFRYQGNAVTDTFAYSARVFATADIAVDIITRATDALVETLVLASGHYTVTIAANGTASIVVAAGKIPSGTQDILVRRAVARAQSEVLPTGTVFPTQAVESALDKLTVISQDIQEEVGRAIKLPVTSSLTSVVLPNPGADRVIGWNATATELENKTPNTSAYLSVSPFMQTVLDDTTAAVARTTLGSTTVGDAVFVATTAAVARTALGVGSNLASEVAIASATTTDLGTAATNVVLINGVVTITGFGSAALTSTPIYFIRFSGILTLTHNATTLIIPGSADITTADGDTAVVQYLGSGNWKVLSYARASGLATVSAAAPAAPAVPSLRIITTSGTYTPTSGMRSCFVEIVGGGAGGGSSGGSICGGGGGSGGESRRMISAATIGASQVATIGAAGAGVSSADGTNGGTTSLGSLLSATGGTGGGVGSASLGGVGGVGSSGDININGERGFPGAGPSSDAGGRPGRGGDSSYGKGGAPQGNQTLAGNGYGTGGGGGNNGAGSAGAAGVIIITEYF